VKLSVETISMTANFVDEEKQVSASEIRAVSLPSSQKKSERTLNNIYQPSAVDVNNGYKKQETFHNLRPSHSNNSQCFQYSHQCSGNSISLDEKLTSDTASLSTENVQQSNLCSVIKVTSESVTSQSEYTGHNSLGECKRKEHIKVFGKSHQEELEVMVKTPEKNTVYK